MVAQIIFFSVLLVALVLYRRVIAHRVKDMQVRASDKITKELEQQSPLSADAESFTTTEGRIFIFQSPQWQQMDSLKQLKLALLLAKEALPVWVAFSELAIIKYPNAALTSQHIIGDTLPAITIDELIFASKETFPASNNAKVLVGYYGFIGPVIAMRDGDWSPPYAIKKFFLSIYFILKSIVEQANHGDVAFYLESAMKELFDCMELSSLYNRQEIIAIVDAGILKVNDF